MARKGFLCGINTYPTAPLRGCVNDVLDDAHALVSVGWREADLRLLLDDRAVKEEWAKRMAWLVDVEPGDSIFYAQSGHGAQVVTRNPRQELDGMDEVYALRPFAWNDIDGTAVRDKEFADYFSRVPPGVNVFVMSDSCSSSDLMRNMPLANPLIIVPRSYPVPPDIAWSLAAARKLGFAPRGILSILTDFWNVLFGPKKPASGATPNLTTAPLAYVSGCKSDQTAADTEVNGRPCGAMTHYFLEQLSLGLGKRFCDVVAAARVALRAAHYAQEPQAEGGKIDQTCRTLLGI